MPDTTDMGVVAPAAPFDSPPPASWEITTDGARPREAWYPRTDVVPSKTNPRKRFAQEKLDELAESIKKHGILQAILVRPLPADPDTKVEIIAGERRWRASGIAGLSHVPVRIIHVNDLDMLELQIIENLQRQDLHELEEAESYEALLDAHKGDPAYGVDQIAAKVGKSRAYVYARLKLCALGTKARAAFYDGELNASTALLLARIPVPDLQLTALKEITKGRWNNGPMSYREAAQHIQSTYMLRLDQAKFKINDATLLPSAGACGECPKRTGANPDLFSDVGRADVCTDPTCFNAKKDAHSERLRLAAKESGLEIITGKDAQKAKPHSYSDELVGYVRPGDHCWQVEGNKTYAKLLGKDAPQPVMIEDPHKGEMIKAYPLDAVKAALRDKGHEISRSKSAHNDKSRKEEEKVKAMRAHRKTVLQRIHDAARERMASGETLSHDDLRLIASHALDRLASDHEGPIKEMWQISRARDADRTEKLDSLQPSDLALLLLDLALVSHTAVSVYWNQAEPKELWAVAKRYGIDPAAVKRELDAQARAKRKAKAPRATKNTDSKPATKTPPKSVAKPASAPAKKAAAGKASIKYRNEDTGETWSGRGKTPRWLAAAEESGRSRDEFLVSKPAAEPAPKDTQDAADAIVATLPVGTRIRVAANARGPAGMRLKCCGRTGTVGGEEDGRYWVNFDDKSFHADLRVEQLEVLDDAAEQKDAA